jgi:hypothetical protein
MERGIPGNWHPQPLQSAVGYRNSRSALNIEVAESLPEGDRRLEDSVPIAIAVVASAR